MATNRAYNPKITGKLQISGDGGTNYHQLHNVTDFSLSGGDRQETTVQTLDHDPVVSLGKPQPKDVSISINASPATEGYRIAYNGYVNERSVTVRYTTQSQRIIDNDVTQRTLAVAATGIVTGVQTMFDTNPNWFPGRGILIGTNNFVIESITSDTSMTVSKVDGGTITAVTATDDWELWDYAVRITLECQVLSAGNYSLTTGGDGFSESLTLKSTGVLPVPTYVFA